MKHLERLRPRVRGAYPQVRMRRNRTDEWCRRLVAENRLAADDFIWPVFVVEGKRVREPVPSMPRVERLSVDLLAGAVGEAKALGIPVIALFPYTDAGLKTRDTAEAFNPENLICRATRAAKKAHPDVGVLCDVALDPYNSDGHDGLVKNGEILNDETVEALCKQALVQAEAGCDVIAPSDMMDGRVGAIREALDDQGFQNVRI
ncbi:MAG: porphobilinogen synthase, partial [Rhodospirillales bacterium]|nr:porphobilinogen synthase [Rhodospirillales bacterium]